MLIASIIIILKYSMISKSLRTIISPSQSNPWTSSISIPKNILENVAS